MIAKTANRGVAFKVSTMGESLLAVQSVVLAREAPELPSSLDDRRRRDFEGFGLQCGFIYYV